MILRARTGFRLVSIALVVSLVATGAILVPRASGVEPDGPAKVAIIVGPVGEEITPTYIALAERAAVEAEARGAVVARAYSPDATPERVIEAVDGAGIVIYFGHGTGFPNPYSEVANPDTVNGWGLQGPLAVGTHADSLFDGTLRYYGEAWLEENLRPAPDFVMIYSNACYAPGASEGSQPPPTEDEALAHVANYSRPILAMGASAYFATDFDGGAASLVSRLLASPAVSYGEVFEGEPLFDADALSAFEHPSIEGAAAWLHRSAYFEGKTDYWYAFAGDPGASFGERAPQRGAVAGSRQPAPPTTLLAAGLASSYPSSAGFEGRGSVALPEALGGRGAPTLPTSVAVCADRCVVLPVVDSCPCYWGTADQRVVNLSHAAWAEVSDAPLIEGLIEVRLYRDGRIPPGEAPRAVYLETKPIRPSPGGSSAP